jgi:hypothetical protein
MATKYPIATFELLPNATGSGFFREDTVRTANPIEIVYPKNRALINRSVVRQKDEKTDAYINVEIRYIYGQPVILKAEQEKMNIKPNPRMDRVEFKNGILTVPKNGATVGLYEFLTNHAQNISNPEHAQHFSHLKPIFREIKPAEDAQQINKTEFEIAEAKMYIKQFLSEKNGGYEFQEERIDALANQFNVVAESYEEKVKGLLHYAQLNPVYFITEARKTEQTTLIEVSHALKLKVIEFAGNTAMYVEKDEKIKSFTGNLNSEEKKMKALANWFQTNEASEAYELFKAELSAAKQANLSKQ